MIVRGTCARPVRASAVALILSLALPFGAACSSTAAVQEAPKVPAARKAAVGKMMRAVERASRPSDRAAAIALLREALVEDPELWEARYNLGILLSADGDLPAARGELEKAHALAPNAEDVVAALGEVLRRSEEPGLAVAVLGAFVKSYPRASQARRVLVLVLRESGQSGEALIQARELLKQRPGDPAALAELALTHLEQDEVDVADLLVQEALKVEPRAAVVERAAGLIALERGEDAVAFAHFARASGLDPKDSAAGLNTATVLLQAGVYDRAEKHFRAVLEAEPESEEAKLGLAAALRGQGSRKDAAPYHKAERLLKEILQTTPGHWAAAHNLAVLYAESMDRPSDATALFTEFLARAPARHPARERAQKWVDDHAESKVEASPRAQQ